MDLFVLDLSGIPMLETVYYDSNLAVDNSGLEALLFNKPVGVRFAKAKQALHLRDGHCSLFLFCHGDSPSKIVARSFDLAIF